MSFFEELKRRNVFRVGVAYVVASWVILQVADLVFEAIKAPDWVLQALIALVVLGFFAALIIAWAYEVTPEGIKRESEIDRSQSVTTVTATKLNHITIGLLIVVGALVIVDRFVLERAPRVLDEPVVSISDTAEAGTEAAEPAAGPAADTDDSKSVAVLPFVNMSSDPEQEFFSDGISEEILNVLTRIPNLKVAARTSSFQFKGQNLDIADIGRQLRVNHVLEGSVRKAGNQLRITAQLIETDSGYHLWSDTYDRQLEDVFAIQDEIARAIAGELRTMLASGSLAPSTPVKMDAYQLYLKGRGLVSTRNPVSLYEAIDLLESALEIEPGYVPAMATLAKAFVVMPWFSKADSPAELREHARKWAGKALEIEPGHAEALAVMGIVVNEKDLDPARAIDLLRQAVNSNPGSLAANNFLGDLALRTGDLETALIYESRAAELDPLAPVHLSDLSSVYLMKGDFQKAVDLTNRALELDPAFGHAHWAKLSALFSLGDTEGIEAALQVVNENMQLSASDISINRNYIHMALGNTSEAREVLAENAALAKAGKHPAVDVAFNGVVVGDFDIAGEMLLLAYETGDGTWNYPYYVRLPEQAPDSEPWQAFWKLPEPSRLAEIRRNNGMSPDMPGFGEGAGHTP